MVTGELQHLPLGLRGQTAGRHVESRGASPAGCPNPSSHCWLLNRPMVVRATAEEPPRPAQGLTLR